MHTVTVGSGFVTTKGCKKFGVPTGTGAQVRAISLDQDGSVRLSLTFSNGVTMALWVRHPNRLEDATFRANRGNPLEYVVFRLLPKDARVPGFAYAITGTSKLLTTV